ncbi:MAG: hypothetical protein NTW06_00160, partial [Candidatus Falkowbacteria bacterium]|nr:hypothetical protein [Candidatus Falkowbacteria bacterium]
SKRAPWIYPDRLAEVLKERVRNAKIITIAYSVNDGFTPILYKVLADELAYRLSPRYFKQHYRQKFITSVLFECFELTGKKEYYLKAIKADPSYRVADNNYGPLYLKIRKFSQAKKEFLKIANVDSGNPYPYIGLGNVALERRNYFKAKSYFSRALKIKNNLSQALSGLAQIEFKLKNFKKLKRSLNKYQKIYPLGVESYYFLGRIYEKEKKYHKAISFYQDSLRLGMNNIDIIKRAFRISNLLKRQDLLEFTIKRYNDFKNEFKRTQKLSKKSSAFQKLKKEMIVLEKKIRNYSYGRNPI